MKKINLLPILFLTMIMVIQLSQSSCANEKLEEPTTPSVCDTLNVTYDNQVKPIVDASCAFSGCHFTGAAIGDYTSYSSMSSILNDNQFKKRVIEIMDMPDGGLTLTPEELEIMECWVASNYAEN